MWKLLIIDKTKISKQYKLPINKFYSMLFFKFQTYLEILIVYFIGNLTYNIKIFTVAKQILYDLESMKIGSEKENICDSYQKHRPDWKVIFM